MSRLQSAINLDDFHRNIVLYGPGVGDIFIENSSQPVNFLTGLTNYLQQCGYERILHVSPTRPVQPIDSRSEELCRSQIWEERPAILSTGIVKGIQVGPYGEIQKKARPEPPQPDGLGDVHGFRLVDAMMREETGFRTALVIYNAEIYLNHFTNKRILGGILSDWLLLPVENQNSIFYVFTNTNSDDLLETIKNSRIPEVKTVVDAQLSGTSPHFRISSPNQEEMDDFVRYMVVDRGLQLVDLDEKQLARLLEAEDLMLRSWYDRFLNFNKIGMDDLRDQHWLSSTGTDTRSFEQKLEELVGLSELKNRILELKNWLQFQSQGENDSQVPNLHMVFYGNPGTGKTTLARLMGEMFHDYGILRKGHLVEVKGSDLVADFVGGTGIKTNRHVDRALDGVLFIDEAYSLSAKDRGGFGMEAIETLLVRMENERDRLVVILAGYPEKMVQFLASNPGLDRRFPKDNRFEFPNFSLEQLQDIFHLELVKRNLSFDTEFEKEIPNLIRFVHVDDESFGNAGEIRNLVDQLERRCKARSFQQKRPIPVLSYADLPEQFQVPPTRLNIDILQDFSDQFTGLAEVKEHLNSLFRLLKLEIFRREHLPSLPKSSLLENFVFLGNPGTGKTSVARTIGQMYKQLGLLRRGHTVEVTAASLIAGYVGQTQEKTRNQILKAVDGILFIDEAYSLSRNSGQGGNSYGQEAIDLLVKMIEDYRDRLVVIVAGYPQEMAQFLTSNPGLKSRFGIWLLFKDFSSEELGEILLKTVQNEGYEIDLETVNGAIEQLVSLKVFDPSHFGNAREVRNLFMYMKRNLANRLFHPSDPMKKRALSIDVANRFVLEDVVGYFDSIPFQSIPKDSPLNIGGGSNSARF